MQEAMAMGQAVYSQGQAGQPQPGQPGQPGQGPQDPSKPDNVVDAEFSDSDPK